MQYEALYTSVLGVAPAIIIAFVIEHRVLFKNKMRTHPVVDLIYLLGIVPMVLAVMVSLSQLSPLPVGTSKGSDAVARFTYICMMLGLAGFIAVLTAAYLDYRAGADRKRPRKRRKED